MVTLSEFVVIWVSYLAINAVDILPGFAFGVAVQVVAQPQTI